MRRHVLQATLGRLDAGRPIPVSKLTEAAALAARAMAEHASRVALQTAQSAEPRDAKKLEANLTAFVGRLPDPDGIVQQVGHPQPSQFVTTLNVCKIVARRRCTRCSRHTCCFQHCHC